jgi:hypothetical protein
VDEQPQNPTQDENNDAPISTNSTQAAKDVVEALGDTIVPDRIAARDVTPPPSGPVTTAPAVEAPAPVQTSEPTQPQPSEQPETATLAETPAETVTTDTPVQEPASTETAEEEEEYAAPAPAPIVPQLDVKNFTDENGYFDANAFTTAVNQSLIQTQQVALQTAQTEVNAQRLEEKQWNQAIERYPQLKSDKALRDIVQNARIGQTTEMYQRAGNDPQKLAAIKIPTPNQVASELFKRLGEAKTQGVQDATENVKIQQTAYQETANARGTEGAPSKRQELFTDIRNPDPIAANKAQTALLKDLLFNEE